MAMHARRACSSGQLVPRHAVGDEQPAEVGHLDEGVGPPRLRGQVHAAQRVGCAEQGA